MRASPFRRRRRRSREHTYALLRFRRLRAQCVLLPAPRLPAYLPTRGNSGSTLGKKSSFTKLFPASLG